MKRMGTIGMFAVVAMLLFASVSDAGIFNRNRNFRYSRPRNVATQQQVRVDGHTEATGTGTNVDGKGGPAAHYNGKTVKPGERAPGHTEATGRGTAVDGK